LTPLLRVTALVTVFIACLTLVSGLYEDWLWYKDLGYEQLFWTPFFSKFFIQLINGTILFVLISATLISARHAFATFYNEKFRKRFSFMEEINQPAINFSEKRVMVSILLVSAAISLVISFIVGFTGWIDVLSFINSSQFNFTDPLFNRDLSFYVFQLPFLYTMYSAFYTPILILALFTALFYVLTGVIKFNSPRIWRKNAVVISSKARSHIIILITILFALKAFGYYLDIYSLVYSQKGQLTGAGFSDIFAALPSLKLMIALSLSGFILSLLTVFTKDSRFITLPITILIASSILFVGILPSFIQSYIVDPDELKKESPYIAHGIKLTRYAYGLDKIETRFYPGSSPITARDLRNELTALNNIMLNDTRAVTEAAGQKQSMRLFYKFNDIDIDRYSLGGEYRQVLLSPREVSLSDLEPETRTFLNTRFKYTHGYGLTAAFANAVNSAGLPVFAVQNVPPQTDYSELTVTEPRLYFGELTNDWAVVNTRYNEYDYPLGNDNTENNYKGRTGIPFTALNRMMISINRATPRFLLSSEITSESKLLLERNIIDRAKKLAPFLKYDDDPYIVIEDGRIKWIIDAYTTASTLPYSSKYLDFNYIRNSVKVVIDAYDGTVDFYVIDYDDPVLQTYIKIFPAVFKDYSQMSLSLKKHLKYPQFLFGIQAEMLNTYHMTDTADFYNKEGAWSIAKELYGSSPQDIQPYCSIVRLPGERAAEFIMMQLFTPASARFNSHSNLAGWLAVRMDGDKYGQLVLYTLPEDSEINSPYQVESLIDQDPEISEQLSILNQKGSGVIRGKQVVLPIAGNFLCIEPIFVRPGNEESLIELKQIIVAYEDKLAMAATLQECLRKIFGWNIPVLDQPEEVHYEEEPADEEQAEEKINMDSLLEQISRIREMLDALENEITTLTNEAEKEVE